MPARSQTARVQDGVEALEEMGRLISPLILARVEYQDAARRGRGVTELNPSGAAAQEMRGLWQSITARLAEAKVGRPAKRRPKFGANQSARQRRAPSANSPRRAGASAAKNFTVITFADRYAPVDHSNRLKGANILLPGTTQQPRWRASAMLLALLQDRHGSASGQR